MFPMKKTLVYLFTLTLMAGAFSCGGDSTTSDVNSGFPSVSDEPVAVSDAGDPPPENQLVMVEPGEGDQNGAIGEIQEVQPNQILCIIIDPAEGDLADLEVCEKSRANESSDSVNGICPEADQETRCASSNEGSGPDFCQVTGDREYIFIIFNFTGEKVTVAYQVVDVTDLPGQSCEDLNINEATLTEDDM